MNKDKTKGEAVEDIGLLKKRITELETTEKIIIDAKELAEATVETVREPLIVLDGTLKIMSVNKAFYQTFKVSPEETQDRFIYDLGNRQWDIPKLRKLLEDILPNNASFDSYEIEHDFPNIGKRIMILNARRIPRPPAKPRIMLLAIEDITELKKTAELIKANIDLKAFNKICVDRELKMVELKKEIDGLLRRLNEKTKYNT